MAKANLTPAASLILQLEDMSCVLAAGRKSLIWSAKKQALDSVRSAATALLANPSCMACVDLITAAHELDQLITLEATLNDSQTCDH